MSSIPENLIKFFTFVVRLYLLPIYLVISLLAIIGLIKGISPQYLASTYIYLFCGITIIFPFRLIRSQRNLRFYFYLLMAATIIILLPGEKPKGVPILPMIIFDTLALLTNLLAVYLYIRHRLNPVNLNPLLEKKAIMIILKVALGGLIATVFIGLYLFLDIRETPRGKQYVRIPYGLPSSEAIFTPVALHSGYKLESTNYVDNHALVTRITKKNITKANFMEIRENDKPLYRIDFEPDRITKTTIWDRTGKSFSSDSPIIYGLDKDGKVVEVPEVKMFIDLKNLDSIYHVSIVRNSLKGIKNNPQNIAELEVHIDKNIAYPHKNSLIPLWFLKEKQKWNLSIQDSAKTTPLFTEILLWYN